MKEKFKLEKSKIIPIVGSLLGIFLILFSGIVPSAQKENDSSQQYYETSFYTETLEKKIKTLCMSISGVEEAEVLLTLDCSTEYVYAQNEQRNKTDSAENISADYLILNQGDRSDAVLLMEIYPKIRGIAIVCTGGNEVVVQKTIIDLLSAALGISSNRIKVAGS